MGPRTQFDTAGKAGPQRASGRSGWPYAGRAPGNPVKQQSGLCTSNVVPGNGLCGSEQAATASGLSTGRSGKIASTDFQYSPPHGVPVNLQPSPQLRQVPHGVSHHQLAPPLGVLLELVQVAPEPVVPAPVVFPDQPGHLDRRAHRIDRAQYGKQRRPRVTQQCNVIPQTDLHGIQSVAPLACPWVVPKLSCSCSACSLKK